MMAARAQSHLASVTIRRLTLPEAQPAHGLGEAIAAALARDSNAADRFPAGQPAIARAIAEAIARHPLVAGTAGSKGGQD